MSVLEKYSNARSATTSIKKTYDNNTLNPHDLLKSLFDDDTFVELRAFASYDRFHKSENFGDGVVACYGQVNGRLVYAYFDDCTYLEGAMGTVHGKKINNVIQLAVKTGSPVICITDSKGIRLQEELLALDVQNEIFNSLSLASGVIPIISVVAGHSNGLTTFVQSLSDFVFLTEKSYMYLSTPTLTNAQTNSNYDFENSYNAKTQVKEYGNAHFISKNMQELMMSVKSLLEFLPSNNIDKAPFITNDDPNRDVDVYDIISKNNGVYDMNEFIDAVFDQDQKLAYMDTYADNLITSFQRLDGITVGVVANNPINKDGEIDSKAARKASRFINICDCFNIPIITLVDTKGYTSNGIEEQNRLILNGGRLVKSYANATSAKLSLIVGNAIGFGYSSMCPKSLGSDFSFALPSATIGIVDAEIYVNVVNEHLINSAENPRAAVLDLAARYREDEQSALAAAKRGLIDDIIDFDSVRQRLIDAVYTLNSKRVVRIPKKHTNFQI